MWRQALPVDPSLGEYPEASEIRPGLFTRFVIAPLVNYLWTLHEQRPDLTLTVAVPELVDRHWWHRIMHEHVAERLQPILQSLPRVVITSVPFHLATDPRTIESTRPRALVLADPRDGRLPLDLSIG